MIHYHMTKRKREGGERERGEKERGGRKREREREHLQLGGLPYTHSIL